MEYNFVNARMFRQGAWPFHGDYHTVAAQRYIPNPDPQTAATIPWVANIKSVDSNAVFYSAFTDNRDVRGYVWAGVTNTAFTPAATLQGESGADIPMPCAAPEPPPVPDPKAPFVSGPGNSPRSRDQNVYAAATLPGLLVESASASKPTRVAVGANTVYIKRAYIVTVYNVTPGPDKRAYRLTIANQPPGSDALPGFASWNRCDAGTSCTRLTEIVTPVEPRSSITRTVYISSTEPRPRVLVNVNEIDGAGLQGYVILNANPNIPTRSTSPTAIWPAFSPGRSTNPTSRGDRSQRRESTLANPEVVPVSELEDAPNRVPGDQVPGDQVPRPRSCA